MVARDGGFFCLGSAVVEEKVRGSVGYGPTGYVLFGAAWAYVWRAFPRVCFGFVVFEGGEVGGWYIWCVVIGDRF